jgi:hypothetical protein
MDSVLTKSAETQVGTLVTLTKAAQQLLSFSATLDEDNEEEDLILVEIEGVGEMVLDVSRLQTYSEGLTGTYVIPFFCVFFCSCAFF